MTKKLVGTPMGDDGSGKFDQVLIKIDKIIRNKKSFYLENCRTQAKNLFDCSHNYMKYIEMYNKLLTK